MIKFDLIIIIIIKKVLEVSLSNIDVYFVNFAVFCFGYSIFQSLKGRKHDTKLETTPTIDFVRLFYFEGDSIANCIDDEIVEKNPTRQIIFGGSLEEKVKISHEEYKECRAYENYNESFEVKIANLNKNIFLCRIGSIFVLIGTFLYLSKSHNYGLQITVLTFILYILIGISLLFIFSSVAKIIFKVKEKPKMPKFLRANYNNDIQ